MPVSNSDEKEVAMEATHPPPGFITQANAIRAFIAGNVAHGHTDPDVAAKLVEDAEAGRDVNLVTTMNARGRRAMRMRAKARLSMSPQKKTTTAPVRLTAERRSSRSSSTTRRASGTRQTRASSSSSDSPPGEKPPPSEPRGRSTGHSGDDLHADLGRFSLRVQAALRREREEREYLACQVEDLRHELMLLVGGAR